MCKFPEFVCLFELFLFFGFQNKSYTTISIYLLILLLESIAFEITTNNLFGRNICKPKWTVQIYTLQWFSVELFACQ